MTSALMLALSLVSAAGDPQADAVNPATICDLPIPLPRALPPAGSEPVIYQIVSCFEAQGNQTLIEPATYLHYIHLQSSRPSEGVWMPWSEESEDVVRADFWRLWGTNFLDDLSIEAHDYVFANGVVGKLVVYRMEERQRVKIVDFTGADVIGGTTAIDTKLRELRSEIRLDTFIDAALVKKVEGVVAGLLKDKGFPYGRVTHAIEELPGGPKLVHLTFRVDEGPKVRIARVTFDGNADVGDRTLKRRLKENKPAGLLSFLTRSGSYHETKFDEDADRILEYYRDRGYLNAQVGDPQTVVLDDESDSDTQWVELVVPVVEGPRYTVGDFTFAGNTILTESVLRPYFKLKPGDVYSQRRIREGIQKIQELYGAGGYFEFVGYPDNQPRDAPAMPEAPAIVDVTLRITEGQQYFINRISFVGNTTTQDNVIRRELHIVEGGVINMEALKASVRRLNQLGYFKPLESTESIAVEKAPGLKDRVNVTLHLEEQNRNQMTFGAGASQVEGFFGNLTFTTANFLGRGESLSLSLQAGQRANNRQLSFTEPFLFDRRLSAGASVYSQKVDYYSTTGVLSYSQVRSGIATTIGRPLRRFSSLRVSYAYEVVDVAVLDELLTGNNAAGVPFSALDEGRHIESRITPALVHDTVDNPLFPHTGRRLTGSIHFAGGVLGGTTAYLKPEAEAIWYIRHTSRTGLGMRATGGWLRPFGKASDLPYYLRFFLGGETQIRGVDFRTVGPIDDDNRALGGNKFALFNVEYYLDIAGPVRALVFHDAGQAFAEGDPLNVRQMRTSTGAELRIVLPVLNVPFRLIYSWNFLRDSFQPARGFKFAVGTTF